MSGASCRLEAENLSFSHGERPVLNGVSLAANSGEIVSLLGANGSGKTTLLRLMMGFFAPGAGAIRLDGKGLRQWSRRDIARRLAYVAQDHAPPFPYLMRDVVMLGRLPHRPWLAPTRAEDRKLVDKVLEKLGVTHLAARPYTEVSGGERQLALIGRALAQGARLIVMDEPMAGLDFGAQIRLVRLLRELAADGLGVLMSTHHPEHAFWGSHRIALLEHGRISAVGAPGDILDADAIRRLYGVRVVATATPGGRIAFMPE